jgi:hypothetical protein
MGDDTTTNVNLAEAEALLRERLRAYVKDLRIVAREGGLVLQGQAHWYYGKQLAQHRAMQIVGLPVLINEIEVRPPPPPERPDPNDG